MIEDKQLTAVEEKYAVLGLASRFSTIPESLQSVGFLHWSARNDKPKRPHKNGDYRVSWSDPDEWISFEEATNSAADTSEWGIGYLNTAGNDDVGEGDLATIDIDGAINSKGELREWVPSLEPFFEHDAYIEYSVSLAEVILGNETDGAGLHIPLQNASIPDWWFNSDFGDDCHEGVDVLSNKFCTVTGVQHPKSGDNVAEYDKWVSDWLREVYKNIRGEAPVQTPDSDSSKPHQESGYLNGGFDEETIRDALSYIDPDVSYDTWRNIGFGLKSEFGYERALSLFKSWSRDGTKWDSGAEDLAERIIGDASETGGCSLGTVIYHAEQHGWKPPQSTQCNDQDVAALINEHKSGEKELTDADIWNIWANERANGDLDSSSIIPEAALRYIAQKNDYYDFDQLNEDIDRLPAKAYNRALDWVNETWADEAYDEDEIATKARERSAADVIEQWEDVRYAYQQGTKLKGRKAARDLLLTKYEFISTVSSETLYLYNADDGIYTDNISEIRGEIYDGLASMWSRTEVKEILGGLQQKNIIEKRHLNAGDTDRALLCVANGVLDLHTGDLHEHSPEYHFVTRIPVEYDPDAETDTYDEFIDSLVSREADKKTLFEMVGHALVPDANERYKKFLILTGDTNNGKSMFYSVVRTLLNGPNGEETNTASVKLGKLAQNRFSVYSMYGSLANIAGEIDGKKIRNTASLKDITGGDEIEIEPKGDDSFFDTLGTTLMFAANDPPIIGERDKQSIATRIVPIELPYTFVDHPDPNDKYEKQKIPERELRAELEDPEALSGLLNLALDGLNRLETNSGDVSLPETPTERLNRYEETADPMREFGMVALENDPDDYIVKADVTSLYKEFAAQQGNEVGSSIGPVLHEALRGIGSLDYTDSKPRSPDYTDTSLPLRGWDDRKQVIDRVTLTDEGLALAKSAGLIADETSSGDAPAFDATPVEKVANDPTGYVTVTVTVLNIDESNSDKVPYKATVRDTTTLIDLISWDDPPSISEGDVIALRNIKTETHKGTVQLQYIDGISEVTPIQPGVGHTPQTRTDINQADIDDLGANDAPVAKNKKIDRNIISHISENSSADRSSTAAAVAGMINNISPECVDNRIEKLLNQGDIYQPDSDSLKAS